VEGYNGKNGWGFDGRDDEATAETIYHLIEKEAAPLYYRRDSNSPPHGWVRMMKEAIHSTAAPFSARRMVKEYLSRLYLAGSPELEETSVVSD
jgi:starch phosphorylase